ncbi:uncharacterized protein F4807DRAFT_469829 [Annulohypoxylon truncatum]|uniref:uncharacterized protein n=1 Tax=Annulohypoxylon truncatum TaxID=327061 RepID=UPI002007CDB7|nr:uncharacterized protein F4807DRAFT_469829 [Annulohypoxylon truncatum]KAI1206778.1 hypothetical protein F4807DRAFT_469829 [Annulohypoxylon truncatum]
MSNTWEMASALLEGEKARREEVVAAICRRKGMTPEQVRMVYEMAKEHMCRHLADKGTLPTESTRYFAWLKDENMWDFSCNYVYRGRLLRYPVWRANFALIGKGEDSPPLPYERAPRAEDPERAVEMLAFRAKFVLRASRQVVTEAARPAAIKRDGLDKDFAAVSDFVLSPRFGCLAEAELLGVVEDAAAEFVRLRVQQLIAKQAEIEEFVGAAASSSVPRVAYLQSPSASGKSSTLIIHLLSLFRKQQESEIKSQLRASVEGEVFFTSFIDPLIRDPRDPGEGIPAIDVLLMSPHVSSRTVTAFERLAFPHIVYIEIPDNDPVPTIEVIDLLVIDCASEAVLFDARTDQMVVAERVMERNEVDRALSWARKVLNPGSTRVVASLDPEHLHRVADPPGAAWNADLPLLVLRMFDLFPRRKLESQPMRPPPDMSAFIETVIRLRNMGLVETTGDGPRWANTGERGIRADEPRESALGEQDPNVKRVLIRMAAISTVGVRAFCRFASFNEIRPPESAPLRLQLPKVKSEHARRRRSRNRLDRIFRTTTTNYNNVNNNNNVIIANMAGRYESRGRQLLDERAGKMKELVTAMRGGLERDEDIEVGYQELKSKLEKYDDDDHRHRVVLGNCCANNREITDAIEQAMDSWTDARGHLMNEVFLREMDNYRDTIFAHALMLTAADDTAQPKIQPWSVLPNWTEDRNQRLPDPPSPVGAMELVSMFFRNALGERP